MTGTTQPTLLVMRAGAIGDMVLTLPALAALRKRFPQFRLVLAARADMLPLLCGTAADDGIAFDSLLLAPLFSAGSEIPLELLKRLGNLQAAVLWLPPRPAESVDSSLRQIGAEQIVSADPMPTGKHAAECLIDSLAPFGIPAQPGATPELSVPAGDQAAWRRLGIGAGTRAVALHVGSGGAAKRWPLDRFVELAQHLAESPDTRVLLVRGPAEDGMGNIDTVRPGITVVDSPSLPALATLLMHCALYVGNDSGITHLAAALGRPTVALFGPTDPAIWGPRGEHVSIVRSSDGQMSSLSSACVWQEVSRQRALGR